MRWSCLLLLAGSLPLLLRSSPPCLTERVRESRASSGVSASKHSRCRRLSIPCPSSVSEMVKSASLSRIKDGVMLISKIGKTIKNKVGLILASIHNARMKFSNKGSPPGKCGCLMCFARCNCASRRLAKPLAQSTLKGSANHPNPDVRRSTHRGNRHQLQISLV